MKMPIIIDKKKKIKKINNTEIQTGSNCKPKSLKFISF